jgi:phosphatidylserine decarboxylase
MERAPLRYYNRETAQLETETVYGEAELSFLYGTRLGGWLRQAFVTRPWFSDLNSVPKRIWLSRKNIPYFVTHFDVDASEAEKPLDRYGSLDEFFARRLRPGVRPIETAAEALVAPADGRALAFDIEGDGTLLIKGQRIAVAELLQSPEDATALSGGRALVIRLAPMDYHRFHFPCDGIVSAPRALPGRLESVHPIALDAGAKSFRNRRDVSVIESPRFGDVHMVEVGALTIGTIVQSFTPGAVTKGQEKGHFRFGGSTVVLLWPRRGPAIDDDLLSNSRCGIETLIKFGSRIASCQR